MMRHLPSISLFILLTCLLLSSLPAAAATLNVGSGETYTTIQSAIDAASPGDIINVAAGTYVEQVSVSKTLTFSGNNQGISAGVTPGSRVAETIVEGGFYIHIGSNFTVIDGFTIEMGYDNGSHKTGVVVGTATDVIVQNNIITDCGMVPAVVVQSDGIEVGYGSDNLTIADNEIFGNWRGVYLNPSDGISITGNAIHANSGVGVGIGSSGQSNLSITGNNIYDHTVEGWGIDTVGSNVVAENNTFLNSGADIAHYGGLTIDASPNWWGDTNPSDDVVGDVTVYPCYTDASMTTLYAPVHNVTQSTYFGTIQAAIDAAIAGDEIQLIAGTYTENIDVNKRVEIIGVGSGDDPLTNTIITQTAAGAGDPKVGVVQLTASGISGDPILFKDLRIKPVGLAGFSVGRFCESTGQSVEYIKLDNVDVIGTNVNPSTEQERGLYVDRTSTLRYLDIDYSAFDNLTYGWYLHKEVSADASTVQYVTVDNTTFTHNNHKGIYVEKLSDATFTGCTTHDNGFDSSLLPSYFQAWSCGFDANLKAGTYANIALDSCIITSNAIDEAKEGVGLTVKARDDGGTYGPFPATVTNVDVIDCTITGNERGLRFGEPGKNNASPTDITVEGCTLMNNTQHYSGSDGSVYGELINMVATGTEVDASPNWWGDLNPTDQVSGEVAVYPCYTDASKTTMYAPVHNVTQDTWFGSIQPAIDAANFGDDIQVAAGTYTPAATINIPVGNLSLIGAGEDLTFIKSSATPLITIAADGVTIQALELTDDVQLVEGVRVVTGAAADLTIANVDFTNVGISGGGNAYGINIPQTFTGLTVTECDFQAMAHTVYTRSIGIFAGDSSNLGDFDVINTDFENIWTGVYLRSAIDGLDMTGNTFTFQACDGRACSAGLYIGDGDDDNFDIENIMVSGNVFSDYTRGVYVWNYGANSTIDNFEITGNTFTNSIYSSAVRFIVGLDGFEDYSIVGISIDDNVFTQNSDIGANVGLVDLRTYDATLLTCNIAVTDNQMTFTGGPYVDAMYGVKLLAGGHPFAGSTVVSGNAIDGGNTGGTGSPASSGICLTHYGNDYTWADDLDVEFADNAITGFEYGLSVYDSGGSVYGGLPAGSTVEVLGNSLSGNTYGVFNDAGTLIDASGNWWGDLDPTDNLSGNVDYSPWLAVGTDTSADPGFQGDFATLHVDDDSPGTGHIQEGVDLVSGSTVNVAPGTYAGNLTLSGNLNLLGTGGALVTTIAGTGGIAVSVNGDDVTIDGFTITNPTGHYAISSSDNGNITISNNIVTDVGTSAADGSVHAINMVCNDVNIDGITIIDNVLHAITGTPNYSISAITIGHSTGTGYVTNALIQGNSIYDVDADTSPWSVGHGAYGILLSHGTGTTGRIIDAQVLDNVIDDLEGLWAHAIGLEGYTPGAVLTGNVISNLVDHKTPSDAVAVMVESNAGAGTVAINGNSFTNLAVGVVSTNTGEIVDATYNWWDAADGPSGEGPGSGCAVGPYIDFTPYSTGNVIFDPDPQTISLADSPGYAKEIVCEYQGGGSGGIYGYSIDLIWDLDVVTASFAKPDNGPFASPTLFYVTNLSSGSVGHV
ncbi:MAG: hypothetical protein GY835_09260, partial [bacterium]|nr:hypothetical protein [bacterium]